MQFRILCHRGCYLKTIKTLKTIIFLLFFVGVISGSHVKGKYRLRVFENRVLRKIFGPKRDEVTEGRGKLHNEEFHNLYSSPNNIRCSNQGR
jgi:hypothetical protein